MKTPLEDLIDATMQEHERRLRLRERDILDCLCERQREVWVLTAARARLLHLLDTHRSLRGIARALGIRSGHQRAEEVAA